MISRLFRSYRENFTKQVVAVFVVVLACAIAISTGVSAMREQQRLRASLIEQGTLHAGILAHNSVVGVFSENATLLREAAAGISTQKDVIAVLLYNADRKQLYPAPYSPPVKPFESGVSGVIWPEIGQRSAMHETDNDMQFVTAISSRSVVQTGESIYFDAPRHAPKEKVIGYAQVIMSKEAYASELRSIVLWNVMVMIVLIIGGGISVWYLSHRATRPMVKLTEQVRDIGEGRTVEIAPSTRHDEVGRLAGAFRAMISSRRAAEAQLSESEDRYRRLVELSPDAIYVQQRGTIVFANAACAQLMGAKNSDALLGSDGFEVIHQDDRDAMNKKCEQAGQGGATILSTPIRYVWPDGGIVDAEASLAPIMFNGIRSVLVIAHDETERKGMEQQLMAYERERNAAEAERDDMETRIEERERHLIAADLHDYVAQNLVGVNFQLGMLKRSLTRPDEIRRIDDVQDILGQTLQYTRSLSVELSPPVLAEIGLRAAVDSLTEKFLRVYGLRVRIEDDGKWTGMLEENARYLLFRSIRELLMNVAKHAQVEEAIVSLAAAGQGDTMQVIVSDNGLGFKAEKVTLKDGGFGLHTIEVRLKTLGGTLTVDSRPGKGTTVIMTAPLGRPDPRNKEIKP